MLISTYKLFYILYFRQELTLYVSQILFHTESFKDGIFGTAVEYKVEMAD